jgi:hypothetical protein
VGGRTHFNERVQPSDLDTREVVDVKDNQHGDLGLSAA